MNDKTQPITIRARWDQSCVPTGSQAQRGLLIEIEAAKPKQAKETERPPVNVALVIDRSGSMRGAPIRAAIDAAVGIAEQLRDEDRLSVICYDSNVDVLVDGARMTARGRKRAELDIRSIGLGGTTNLAGGWQNGSPSGPADKHRIRFKW